MGDDMKNLLSINQTAATGLPDGAAFLTMRADRDAIQKMQRIHRKGVELHANNGTEIRLGIVRWGSFLLLVFDAGDLLRERVSLAEFVQQRSFPATVGLFLLFLMTFPIGSYIKKQHQEKVILTANTMQRSLGISPDCTMLKLLWYTYQEADGTEVNRQWARMQCFAEVQDGSLCISNLTMRFEIPLPSLTAIHPTDQSVLLAKENITLRCCIVEIHDEKGDFCIAMPEESVNTFCMLTGLLPKEGSV